MPDVERFRGGTEVRTTFAEPSDESAVGGAGAGAPSPTTHLAGGGAGAGAPSPRSHLASVRGVEAPVEAWVPDVTLDTTATVSELTTQKAALEAELQVKTATVS